MSEIELFDVAGESCRFGVAPDGRAYVVASDYAKRLGYRDAADALRNVEDAEKGTQIVRTPGGDQRMSVLYEEGIWELIFLSRRPEARAIKARVKKILRTIRQTGRYEVAQLDELEVARRYVLTLEAKRALETKVAELEPSAEAWNTLASADGDYSVREAAFVLNRDPSIQIGQNRLFGLLREWRLIDGRDIPYAAHETHVRLRTRSYPHPQTGEEMPAKPQVRITAAGLRYLHRRMGGTEPLAA